MNKIIVIGNLGRDPEMRYTPSGQAVTSFSVASNRRYTTASGEQRDETECFNVSAWGRLGELCNQDLTKGKQVYAECTLRSQTWEGQDGTPCFANTILLRDVQFLGSRGSQVEGRTDEPDQEEPDLPF